VIKTLIFVHMYECLHLSFFHATCVESMPGTAIRYV
jgi:hypothetical protein